MVKYLGLAFLTALFTCFLSAWFTLEKNPEVLFWKGAVDQKLEHLDQLDREKPVVFFVGGSSCAFSVDPGILEEEFGLQSVNLGLHAGSGRALQTELALRNMRKGDLLVLAYETNFWQARRPFQQSPLGSQIYYSLGDRLAGPSEIEKLGIDPLWKMTDVRPGGRLLLSLLSKKLLGRKPYRYEQSDVSEGGLIQYSQGLIKAEPSRQVAEVPPSEAALTFLRNLVNYAKEREWQVVVTLPWQFVREEKLHDLREANTGLRSEIDKIALVLPDQAEGAQSDPSLFSDTLWHLTGKGSGMRTRRVGVALSSIIQSSNNP